MILLWIAASLAIFAAKYAYDHFGYYSAAFRYPTALPGIPNILAGYLTMATNHFDFFQAFSSLQRAGSGAFSAIWFPSFTVLVRKSEHLQTVLTSKSTLDKTFHYEGLKCFIGKHRPGGLIPASGDKYQPCKKLFYNTFNSSSVDVLFESLLRGAEFLIRDLEQKVGQGEFEMIPIARRFGARNVMDGAADYQVAEDSTIMKLMVKRFQAIEFNIIRMGVFHNFPLSEILFPFKRNLLPERSEIHQLCQMVYNEKKMEYSAMANEEVPRQYIYNLIREAEQDDSIDIYAELTTLLAAAIGTTATAICTCLELLAMHPEVQQRVYLEDQQVQVGLRGRAMVDGDLDDYEYLHRVVKETLRLCPTIPVIARCPREDLVLGEQTIPEGATAMIFLPLFHRDPDNFPDPMRFDPDRFLPEEVAKRHKLAYLPFSYGQRVCPGMRYGTQSIVMAISTVVRHYHVYTKYKTIQELDQQLRAYISLINVEGYPIRLERRSEHREL